MAEIKFEITKHLGVLSQSTKGWTKELNLVSWNDREPKYDIRPNQKLSYILTMLPLGV